MAIIIGITAVAQRPSFRKLGIGRAGILRFLGASEVGGSALGAVRPVDRSTA